MKASIIKIGNSRGVRIPKTLLIESGLDKDVSIIAYKGVIKITKAPTASPKPRTISPEYAASLETLKDWESAEEDKAWASLQ